MISFIKNTYVKLFEYCIKPLNVIFFSITNNKIIDVMQPYELDAQCLAPIIEKLSNNPENFVDFRMKFESEIEKPDPARFLVSYYFVIMYIYF